MNSLAKPIGRVVEAAGSEAQRSSTAMEAARALAAVCRKHGLLRQAGSLEAQTAAMEASIVDAAIAPPASDDTLPPAARAPT
jgi:hypothetical protein